MIYDAKKREVRALDYIGAAPAAATLERFTVGARLWDTAQPVRDSFMAPVVPGNLAGLAALLEQYGSMSCYLSYLGNPIPYLPGTDLVLEREISLETEKALAARGHRLRSRDDRTTNMLNAIRIYGRSRVLSDGADPREAHAAGW